MEYNGHTNKRHLEGGTEYSALSHKVNPFCKKTRIRFHMWCCYLPETEIHFTKSHIVPHRGSSTIDAYLTTLKYIELKAVQMHVMLSTFLQINADEYCLSSENQCRSASKCPHCWKETGPEMRQRDRTHMKKLLPGTGPLDCGKVQARKITGMNREKEQEEGGGQRWR